MNFLRHILLVSLLLLPLLGFGQDDNEPTTLGDNGLDFNQWPTQIRNTLRDFTGNSTRQLQQQIFRAISDIDILDEGIDLWDGNEAKIKINVERKVYDNLNVLNSHTVVDVMRIPVSIPIYVASDVPTGTGAYWGFSFGTRVGIDFMNIRQVMPHKIQDLVPPKELEEQIQSSEWATERAYNEIHNNDDNVEDRDPSVSDDDEDPKRWRFFRKIRDWFLKDPLRNARYSKFWNLVWHPVKIPVTVKHFNRLTDGEIVSYGVNGAVELGAGAGFNIDVTSQSHIASVGLTVTTYLMGDFRVSVMKEAENVAWVKLTRVGTWGVGGSFGFSRSKTKIFDGFTVFGQRLGKLKLAITPFNFTLNRQAARAFEVGYRYDLTNPAAVEAYKKALYGRFAMSEDIAREPTSQDPPVTKLFKRQTKSTTWDQRVSTELSLLYAFDTISSRTFSDVRITLPDGSYRVFKTHTLNSRQWDFASWRSERLTYSFLYDMLVGGSLPDTDQKEGLVAEGRIEDSHTSGKEINAYITEVEHAVNKRGKFKRPPLREPLDEDQLEEVDEILAEAKDDIREEQNDFDEDKARDNIKLEKKIRKIVEEANDDITDNPGDRDRIVRRAKAEMDELRQEFKEEWDEREAELKEEIAEINQDAQEDVESIRGKKARYGRSGFLYRVYFNKEQLFNFVNVKEKDMWKHLEKAFGKDSGTWGSSTARMNYTIKNLPKSVANGFLFVTPAHLRQGSDLWHARNIRRKWKNLKSAADPINTKKFMRRLGRFFMDSRYGYELVKLLKTANEGEKLPYDLNAFNRSFGSVNETGGSLSSVNVLLERTDRLIAFDFRGPRIPINPNAITGRVKLKDLEDGTYNFSFFFNKKPEYVYIKFGYLNNITSGFKETYRAILSNQNGLFKAGFNQILLDPKKNGLAGLLGKAIKPGSTNVVAVAMALDRDNFGRVDDDDEYISVVQDDSDDDAPPTEEFNYEFNQPSFLVP